MPTPRPAPHPARIVSTPLRDARGLDAPVTEIFLEAAARWPEREFIVSLARPAESVTFAQFLDQARRVAAALRRQGVRPGDRVAIFSGNRPRWCVAHAGILLAHGVAVGIDAQATDGSLRAILEDSGAALTLCSGALAPRVPGRMLSLDEDWDAMMACAGAAGGVRIDGTTGAAQAASRPRPSASPAASTTEVQGAESFLQDVGMRSLQDVDTRQSLPDVDTRQSLQDAGTWQSLPEAEAEAEARQSLPGADTRSSLQDALGPAPGGDATMALVYTSGTTGEPKGSIVTHSAMRLELHGIAHASGLSERDAILQFLPLHHVLAQVGTYLAPAHLGMRVVHADIARPEDLGSALQQGITVVLAVPQVFHLVHARIVRRRAVRALVRACGILRERAGIGAGRLLCAPLRRAVGRDLRLLVSGGAALDPIVQRDLLAMGFTTIQAYGLTETAGGAVADLRACPRPGVAGLPLPGMELRIDAPDPDGIGEICLRGGLVTPGYRERPEESAELVKDGWLRTGDLGRLEHDDRLVIVGRRKEIIVLPNGKNVNPEEIEAHLQRSPWIAETCVLEHDGRLHAVVVPRWDRLRDAGIAGAREALRFELQSLALRLPPAQRVTSFALRRAPLPRTSTRKLQRRLVDPRGDEAPSRAGEGGSAPKDPRLTPALEAIVRRHAGERALLGSDAHLELDLGLDSLKRLELVLELQSRLAVRLGDDELARATTLGALLDALHSAEHAPEDLPATWSATLAQASPDELPPEIRHGRGPFVTLALAAMVAVARVACAAMFRLRVEGLEHLPSRGSFLICPNHVSFLDGFVVGAALPLRLARRSFVLGEASHVSRALARPFARVAGVVAVDPGRHLRRALRAGAAGLRRGMILLVFPEGERSADGTLQAIRPGAPILSAELGAPIVPALIEGTFEAWPRGRSWPRPGRVRVSFGAPLDPVAIVPPGTPSAEAHARVAGALQEALRGLASRNSGSRGGASG